MTDEEKEFERFFEDGKYILKFSLVPPNADVGEVIKQWMQEAHIAAWGRNIDHLNLMLQTEREESERWMKKEEILRIRVRELVSLLSCQGRGPNK